MAAQCKRSVIPRECTGCMGCAAEPAGDCYECGHSIYEGDRYYEIRGEVYCKDCVSRSNDPADHCGECNEEISPDGTWYSVSGEVFCSECVTVCVAGEGECV